MPAQATSFGVQVRKILSASMAFRFLWSDLIAKRDKESPLSLFGWALSLFSSMSPLACEWMRVTARRHPCSGRSYDLRFRCRHGRLCCHRFPDVKNSGLQYVGASQGKSPQDGIGKRNGLEETK